VQQERGLSATDYSGLDYLECEESNHGAVPDILPLNLPFNKKKSTTTKRVITREKIYEEGNWGPGYSNDGTDQ
jgi:hypothetical protein